MALAAADDVATEVDLFDSASERALFNERTVLLAEDNPVNQEVARELLAALGFDVSVASDGQSALQSFLAHKPDVVLMDCQMPVLDGYAATRAIRDAEVRSGARRTPIVALTGNALSGDRERCLASGMDDFIGKPFQTSELARVLNRWLAASRQGNNLPH
ncbi:MAG: response regulator [Gammaproteobacteria bacterium]|nr:response regulator [Gammaproteobacteria bacterium]